MSRNIWTEQELKYLRRFYPSKGSKFVAKKLNRSIHSVISKTSKLGIKYKNLRPWQKWEDNYLIRHYTNRKVVSIARTLKRSLHAVANRAQKLGLTTPKERVWTDEEKDFLIKHYPDHSFPLKEIAVHIKRSYKSIYSYAKILKINRPRYNHLWTKEEHDYLISNYKTKRFKDIAADLGLSSEAVILYANRNGIFRKAHIRRWTENDIEYVRQNYATLTAEDIGNALGRTVQSIRQCAGRLGLQNKHNWYKPANFEARVRKYKTWRAEFEKERKQKKIINNVTSNQKNTSEK